MKSKAPPTRPLLPSWTTASMLRRLISASVLCAAPSLASAAALKVAQPAVAAAASAKAGEGDVAPLNDEPNLESELEEIYTDPSADVAAAETDNHTVAAAVAAVADSTTAAPPAAARPLAKKPDSAAATAKKQPAKGTASASGPAAHSQDGLDNIMEDRVQSAEQETQQLRQLLRQADGYETGLWNNITKFKNAASHAITKAKLEVRQVPKLKRRLRKLATQEMEEENLASARGKQISSLEGQLSNASRFVDRTERALKWAQLHLASMQKQNSGLVNLVRNESEWNKELLQKLKVNNQTETTLQKQLQTLGTRLVKQGDKTKRAFQEIKAKADQRIVKLEKRDAELTKESKDMAARETGERKIISNLRDELKRSKLHNTVDDAQKAELQKLRRAVVEQEKDSKEEEAKLREMSAAVRVLERKTELLTKRSVDGDKARDELEHKNRDLVKALQRLKAENKQLRGSTPWLEAKLASEAKDLDKTKKDLHDSLQERDTLKAMVKNEQGKIMELENTYAESIEAMGRSYGNQARGGDPAAADASTPESQADAGAAAAAPADAGAAASSASDSSQEAATPAHEDDFAAVAGSANWGV
eukprot:TRINITY_DN82638_c0_g1_i1.p1 TRINITY_DN82638_c0_g1~~TRINITY_DN82638_c0_g1_i1.p1  ORF type:complete len:592 (+),score=243.93 TRINITY_DN82638_c0_g1_i1:38-1813(+)